MMRAAFASTPQMAIVPIQDVLRLGGAARMNTPGTASGNWQYRLEPGVLSSELAQQLKELSEFNGRNL
jgi:4-alpha-glucanotransferase